METEFAVFVLKVSDIQKWDFNPNDFYNPNPNVISIENNVGIIKNSKLNITWKDVNFQTILGDMYDKYDLFNIEMARFSSAPYTSNQDAKDEFILNSFHDKDNQPLICNIKGFNFFNSSYNTKTQSHQMTAPLFILSNEISDIFARKRFHRHIEDLELSIYTGPWKDRGLTFHKQKYVNMNLFFTRMNDDSENFNIGTAIKQMPHWSIHFIVRPITKQ